MSETYRIRIINSFADIDPAEWDGLLGGGPVNPFLTHAFLNALEVSGSATRETGWLGQHLILEDDDEKPIAALPCYLKNHSQGEYVFDHGWADAFMRAGGEYYPKLQCSIPFTPATGPRFLAPHGDAKEACVEALAQGLKQLCERMKVSSAHITFMEEADWQQTGDNGYLRRTDQQFHWVNDSYGSFDDFLSALSSRKRKNIKKERRIALEDNGITIEHLTGGTLTEEAWDRFFEFYMDTGSRKWGQPYLTREFFTEIGKAMPDRTLLIMAKRNGEYIAGALNFIGDECLYGRHWGCVEDHPCLHFEICYYQAIEYAIDHKIARVEAGAQGAHKLARGYLPVVTRSAHWITHPGLRDAVADYLVHERQHVDMENKALAEHAPFKKEN